jgi:hypothetical protein
MVVHVKDAQQRDALGPGPDAGLDQFAEALGPDGLADPAQLWW